MHECRLHWHKKPESFSHSGFSLKVARQLPLNTPKNPNRKTHLRSVIFWNSAKISLVFCQCKRLLQSRRYYSGFWSRGTWPSAESPDRGPRRNAHYTRVRSKVERSRACAPLTKTQVWDCFFLFVPKTLNVMGFSGSVNGTTDFGFCQCKWPFVRLCLLPRSLSGGLCGRDGSLDAVERWCIPLPWWCGCWWQPWH